MKTQKKALASILCLALLVFSVLSLTSCDISAIVGGIVNGECAHAWGQWTVVQNATCLENGTQERICKKCGEIETDIIEKINHTASKDDGDCTTPITCSICGIEMVKGNDTHTGGSATCEKLAECQVCGKAYGEYGEHVPGVDDNDCTTPICCAVCGEPCGEAGEHVPGDDDGDCTTDILCIVCGSVAVGGNDSHVGGSATCIAKAECEICGMEYGEYGEHADEARWIKHIDDHYIWYSCCETVGSEPEAHNKVDGVCTVCGFNPTIEIASVTVAPGEKQVAISISVKDNPGITGLQATLQYSSDVLTLVQAKSGDAFADLEFTHSKDLVSGCKFMWDSAEIKDEDVLDGEFLILIFDISESATSGDYGIIFTVKAYDNDFNFFNLSTTGGKVTVEN